MPEPIHVDKLELALSATRSRTSEAELAQEAVRWDAGEGRYVPEVEDGGDITAVPTPTLTDSHTRHSSHVGEKDAPSGTSAHPWLGRADSEKPPPPPAELAAESKANNSNLASAEPIWVEWDEGDAENPYNWSRRKKWLTTIVVCSNCALCNWTGAAFGLGSASMMRELGMGREMAALGLAA